jgi:Protein of unknown function (DUF2927)
MVMSRDKICYLSCLSGSGGVRQRAQPLAVLAAIGLAFVAVAGEVRGAENPEISMKRSTQRLSFTNEEIIDGFYKIAFGAELQLDQPVERIRKFDGPVRVFVINQGGRDRLKRIAAVVGDIRARVNHLDIAMTEDRRAANLIVRLVPPPLRPARLAKHSSRPVTGARRQPQTRARRGACREMVAKGRAG